MNMTKQAENARRQRMSAARRIIDCSKTRTMEYKHPDSTHYSVKLTVKQGRKKPHFSVAHVS